MQNVATERCTFLLAPVPRLDTAHEIADLVCRVRHIEPWHERRFGAAQY